MVRLALALLGLLLAGQAGAAERLMPYMEIEVDPYEAAVRDALARHPQLPQERAAVVSVAEQRLYLYEQGLRIASYPVSTSRYGVGNRAGSEQTPLGAHRVRRKIGADAPIGRIFKAREDTGLQAQIVHEPVATGEDHVTTRILWLDGLEPGRNKGGEVDSYSRYIYIHGTHEEGLIGRPASHGCVRMRNADVVALFDQLPLNALVLITE